MYASHAAAVPPSTSFFNGFLMKAIGDPSLTATNGHPGLKDSDASARWGPQGENRGKNGPCYNGAISSPHLHNGTLKYPRPLRAIRTREMYDLIVVRGGPTGLTAGIYARTRDLSTLILEALSFGGQLTFLYPTKSVYDYPSYIAIEAEELGGLFVNHAREAGCEMREGEEVLDIKRRKHAVLVTTT